MTLALVFYSASTDVDLNLPVCRDSLMKYLSILLQSWETYLCIRRPWGGGSGANLCQTGGLQWNWKLNFRWSFGTPGGERAIYENRCWWTILQVYELLGRGAAICGLCFSVGTVDDYVSCVVHLEFWNISIRTQLVQLLWRTAHRFVKERNLELSCDAGRIPLPGIYAGKVETLIRKETHTSIFIA